MRLHSFYNVGHGDAVLIRDATSLVVRDIGQPSRIKKCRKQFYQNCLSLALNVICYSDLKRYAVVSHAHEDHFSGFMKLYYRNQFQIFEECYIPPLVTSPSSAFRVYVGDFDGSLRERLKQKVDLYLKIFASLKKNSATKKTISNWFFLLPVMNFLSKKVYQVSFSDKILNGDATVLWPYLAKSAKDGNKYDDVICEKMDDLESALKLELENPFIGITQEEEFNRYVDEIVSIYLKILDSKEQGQDEKGLYVERISTILKNVSNNIKVSVSYSVKVLFCRAINNDDDNQGVAFQYDDASAIYLCDFYGVYIDKMLTIMNKYTLLKSQYELLKSSHHGSRYGQNLQNVTYNGVIHCCGIGTKAHKGPDVGYLNKHRRSFCMDWDFYSSKWDARVYKASLPLVYPCVKKSFKI